MFSETVDTVVNRSKRPDRLTDCINYVNAANRQLHGLHFFGADSCEERLHPPQVRGTYSNGPGRDFAVLPAVTEMFAHPADHAGLINPSAYEHNQFIGGRPYYEEHGHRRGSVGNVYAWKHPPTLRKIDAVRFDGKNIAAFQLPSRQQMGYCHYYYRSGDNHVFVGWDSFIDLYYYEFPPYMQYYKAQQRPMKFDRATNSAVYLAHNGLDWMTTLGNAELERQVYRRCCDWMLERWNELVVQTALTMLYVSIQDPRAAQTQALAKELEKTMVAAEANYANGVS